MGLEVKIILIFKRYTYILFNKFYNLTERFKKCQEIIKIIAIFLNLVSQSYQFTL